MFGSQYLIFDSLSPGPGYLLKSSGKIQAKTPQEVKTTPSQNDLDLVRGLRKSGRALSGKIQAKTPQEAKATPSQNDLDLVRGEGTQKSGPSPSPSNKLKDSISIKESRERGGPRRWPRSRFLRFSPPIHLGDPPHLAISNYQLSSQT